MIKTLNVSLCPTEFFHLTYLNNNLNDHIIGYELTFETMHSPKLSIQHWVLK